MFFKGFINLHAHLIDCDGRELAESYTGHQFPYPDLMASDTFP